MASRIISVLFKSNAGTEAGKVAVYGKAITGVGGSSKRMASEVKASGGIVQNALGSMGVNAKQFGTVMQAGMVGGAVAGGAALVSLAKKGVDAFVGLAGEVRNFQRATGASAEDSSRWVAVLDDMEIASDKGEKAAFKLARTIGDGGEKLRQYGVEIATNKDGTVNLSETLLNVADAYTSTEDPARRASLVQEAFGRGGKDLIPVLEQGREGIRRFFEGAEEGHQILSQDEIDKAREYELAMDRLGDVTRGFALEVGSAVVPTLTTSANAFSTVMSAADRATSPIGGVGRAFELGAKIGLPALGFWENVGGVFEKDASIMERTGSALRSVVPGLSAVWQDGSDSASSFADEQGRLADAQTKVADLEAQGRQGTEEYAQARRDLRAASAEFAPVQQRVSDATQDVAMSMAMEQFAADPLAASLKDVAAASDDIVRSQFGVSSVIAGSVDSKIKARDAEREFLVALSEGDIEKAESAALTAAAARSQQVYNDAILQGVNPAVAAKDAAGAYRLELGMIAQSLPPDSPLRAYVERDLGLMEAHKEGMKGKNATLWADLQAIANTGGQNVTAVEQFWRDWGATNHKIKDENERLTKGVLMQDLLNIINTGGSNQWANQLFWNDVQQLTAGEGGKKVSKALTDALADGVITSDEIMGLWSIILNEHVGDVTESVGQSRPVSRGGPKGAKPARYGMAAGGLMEDHRPQIAQGRTPVRVWAEPETHWEAYIPGAPSKRKTALPVLGEVADRFGFGLVPKSVPAAARAFAEGGLTLEELFYDPRGGWKRGQSIGAIGGHGRHVHAGASVGHTWHELDAYLMSQGIIPGPGSTTGGSHVAGSLHYQNRAKDYGDAANPNLDAIWNAFLPLAGGVAAALGIKLKDVPALIGMGPGGSTGDARRAAGTHMRNAVVLWQAALQAEQDAMASAGGGGGGGGGAGGDFKAYAASRLAAFGWGPEQMAPLDLLWTAESGWNPNARNPSSGAAGIPQDITGDMHGGGHGQVDWGLNYIKQRYGSPMAAWAFWQRRHWYGDGGLNEPVLADWGADLVPGINVLRNNTGGIEKLRPVDSAGIAHTTNVHFHGDVYGDERAIKAKMREVVEAEREGAGIDMRRA